MVFELRLGFTPLRIDEPMQVRRLTFAGKAAHSSTPALGINAIEIALEAMAINLKLNLAAISGGTAVNVVPARCDVVVATDAALDVPIGGAIEAATFEGGSRRSSRSKWSPPCSDSSPRSATMPIPAAARSRLRGPDADLQSWRDPIRIRLDDAGIRTAPAAGLALDDVRTESRGWSRKFRAPQWAYP